MVALLVSGLAVHVLKIAREAAPPGFELLLPPDDVDDAGWDRWARKADLYLGTPVGLTPPRLESLRGYRLVQLMTTGYDQLDIPTLRHLRIPVANSGGANAAQVAEYTVMLILACLKRLCQDNARVHAGGWRLHPDPQEPLELHGKTVGLVGFGNIGRGVARRLRGWDVTVMYYDMRRPSTAVEEELASTYAPLEELLRVADIVSLHVPLSGATHRLIDGRALAAMKQGAILINTSRGGTVDEDALHGALSSGHLLAAALDVFASEPPSQTSPLRQMDNAILTPHTAGNSTKAWTDAARRGFANLERVVRGEAPDYIIPELLDVFRATPNDAR